MVTSGPGEPGMNEQRKRKTELLFLELEGVRKENQEKAPPCPGEISHLEAAGDSTGFPGQEPPESRTGKVGRDWHSR